MKLSPRLAEAKRLLDECRPPREVARLMGVTIRTLREYQKRIQEGGYARGRYRQFRSYAIALADRGVMRGRGLVHRNPAFGDSAC